jgi:hypothetical protein
MLRCLLGIPGFSHPRHPHKSIQLTPDAQTWRTRIARTGNGRTRTVVHAILQISTWTQSLGTLQSWLYWPSLHARRNVLGGLPRKKQWKNPIKRISRPLLEKEDVFIHSIKRP